MTSVGLNRWIAIIVSALVASACGARPAQEAPRTLPESDVSTSGNTTSATPSASGSEPDATGEPPTAPANVGEPAAPSPAARFEALPVTGHLDAVVSLPATTARQPVLFATHGAGGAPEHHCVAWRMQLGEHGIVVCPRGAMINRRMGPSAGFYYPDHFALEKEVLATLESFEAAYAERIVPESYVYAGYSQGATMGALMLPAHAGRFKRALLIEGGFNAWALSSARRFAESGGERVAFVCGVASCNRGAEKSVQILARADLLALSKHAPGAGHTYLGAVADRIQEALPWLIDGHPGWQADMSAR